MKPITVLLAEDHTLVREGIRMILNLETDLDVVGEAHDGRQAIKLALESNPDVVLMDIAMPGLNGLEATRQLLKVRPGAKIIILTAHCDDTHVKRAAESGAMGFLLKQDSTHDVCRAIREVHQGRIFYCTSVSDRFTRINSHARDLLGNSVRKPSVLTSREMEILQLIAEGKANKEAAAELGISIKTVEKHRGQLMKKLDIHDTASLTRHAISAGIIESSVQVTML
jgi:DNA-binding NarL/FixJ family response regulator